MNNTTQQGALVGSVSKASGNVSGSTPTYQAWDHAVDVVAAWQPGANDPASMATAERFLVLITDGVPTIGEKSSPTATSCSSNSSGISSGEYELELTAIDNKTKSSHVKTFVVGVVGSNNPQGATFDPLYMLSRIAVIGGTEQPPGCVPVSGTPLANDVQPRGTYCHYDLSASTDLGASLTTTLSQIASSALSCTYSVPPPSGNGQTIDPSQTVLVYTDGATGQPYIVLQNTSATCDKAGTTRTPRIEDRNLRHHVRGNSRQHSFHAERFVWLQRGPDYTVDDPTVPNLTFALILTWLAHAKRRGLRPGCGCP